MRQLFRVILFLCFSIFTFCTKQDDCGKFKSDRCLINEENFRKIDNEMSKKEVESLIGHPFSEIPDYANSFSINHCVWQRYRLIDRGEIKNVYIVIDFKNDSIISKKIEKD